MTYPQKHKPQAALTLTKKETYRCFAGTAVSLQMSYLDFASYNDILPALEPDKEHYENEFYERVIP